MGSVNSGVVQLFDFPQALGKRKAKSLKSHGSNGIYKLAAAPRAVDVMKRRRFW
jgi:hypothetical protein